MAIHPKYADAILDGDKHVEFRKRPLAPDVATVIIYATMPVKRIVGEFSIVRTLNGSPSELWQAVGADGAIDVESYAAYYSGSVTAVGIVVSGARRYPQTVALAQLTPEPAVPQSYTYVTGHQVELIRDLAGADPRPAMARLAGALSALARAALPQRIAAVFPLPMDYAEASLAAEQAAR
jgi:predicted transcriptional regulator